MSSGEFLGFFGPFFECDGAGASREVGASPCPGPYIQDVRFTRWPDREASYGAGRYNKFRTVKCPFRNNVRLEGRRLVAFRLPFQGAVVPSILEGGRS